jgi:hypothetical protein
VTAIGSPRHAVVRIAGGAAVVATVWCSLLPRLLEWPPIARHVALMEERKVDPAAMYYSELERLPLRPAWIDDVLVLWPWGGDSIRSGGGDGPRPSMNR